MENAKKILVPVDFSPTSLGALPIACQVAGPDSEIHLVHVNQPEMVYAHSGGTLPPDSTQIGPTEEQLNTKLNELELPATMASNAVHRAVISGSPAAALVDYAKSNDIDMIVMTTHGEKGLVRLLMGSVAEHVVRNAPCPVLTFKAGLA